MIDGAELSDLDISLYRYFTAHPSTTLDDAAHALGRDTDELDKPAAHLLAFGLLETDSTGSTAVGAHADGDARAAGAAASVGERYAAVSPMLAEVTELGAEELELSARRAAVEARRNAIRQVIPDWVEVLRHNPAQSAVDVVTERVAMANVLMHYAERCQRELLSVAPGRGPGRVDPRTRMANLYSLSRGVQTRALYQHVAIRDRATRSYLREMTNHGAKIRLAPSVPGRSLVIDREVALLTLPGPDPATAAGVAVVREPTVIAWVIATFEQLWAEASPLEDLLGQQHADDAEIDHTRAAILRLMAEGEKDEAISRRLSISVRTCRRHIADYMAQVGATSRFQAGVIAARNGHLDSAPIPLQP